MAHRLDRGRDMSILTGIATVVTVAWIVFLLSTFIGWTKIGTETLVIESGIICLVIVGLLTIISLFLG